LMTPVGGNVFYRFTVENTGDLPLLSPTLTDNNVNVSACNASCSGLTLPVAVPQNDNHIIPCIVGPISAASGSHPNTASVSATFNGNPVASPNSIATYATTGLTLVKSATQTTFTNAGDTLNYSYLVTNSGFAPLQGPVTVSDDKATATCHAVKTVGDLDNFLDPGEPINCTASAMQPDPNPRNNTDNTYNGDTATLLVDVTMNKQLTTDGPFTAGQSISYTLTVGNNGPSTATSVQVTDTPTNLTITNVSGGG